MPTTPHDALFRGIFSQPLQAAELLRHAFPPGITSLLDFTTIKQEPGSFVDEAMAQHHTDLLFTVRFAGRDIRIYVLFEHQSTVEPRMPLRLLEYMMRIWRLTPRGRPIPVVLPVVLHHSDTGWVAATDFEALFGPDIPTELREFVPRFRFMLDDLSRDSDDLLMHRALSATARLALSALKHARSADDLARFVPDWTQLVREVLREPQGVRALQLVFRYLSHVRGPREAPTLDQIAAPAIEEANMQTIAEFYEEKFTQKGEQKLLLNLLRHRFGELPATTLEKIEAADGSLLERWAVRILGANTLDEVFA